MTKAIHISDILGLSMPILVLIATISVVVLQHHTLLMGLWLPIGLWGSVSLEGTPKSMLKCSVVAYHITVVKFDY